MATTGKERSYGDIKLGKHTRPRAVSDLIYEVGPDDLDSKLIDVVKGRMRHHWSTVPSHEHKPSSKAHHHFSPKLVLLDVASLAKEASPDQSTVLFRLNLHRGHAKGPKLVVEPEKPSTDMTQEMLDASIQLVRQPDAEVEALRRALTQRTVDNVLKGTRWLSSSELNSVRKEKTSNPSMTIGRWLQSGSMFALEPKGSRLIPAYALDQLGEPIALLKPVLSLMKGRTSFLIAAWFEAPNTYLDGKRPRELLATRGLDVVRAAEMHVAEDFHG